MIKKIKSIDCASYKNFNWDNNLSEFKNINIFYGHNGAGKTILSRIMRNFELKQIHQDYQNMKFEIDFDGRAVTQDNIEAANLNTAVYNKDFINENLNFLINGKNNGNIKSFSSAIIGKDNDKILKEIEELQIKLGNSSNKEQNITASGLYGEKEHLENDIKTKEEEKQSKNQDHQLRNKANEIKNIMILGENTYDIRKIKQDIEKVKENIDNYILTTEVENQHINSLNDEVKENLEINIKFNENDFAEILKDSREIVEYKFIPIENIENDLRKWLEEGLKFHDHNSEIEQECKFCKNKLSKDRIEWLLSNLKDKALEENNSKINDKLSSIQRILNEYQSFLSLANQLKSGNFYTDLKSECEKLQDESRDIINKYFGELSKLEKTLKDKLDTPYDNIEFIDFIDYSTKLNKLIQDTKNLIDQNNVKTQNLENTKKETRQKVKFSKVANFVKDISYFENLEQILNLDREIKNLRAELVDKEQEIVKCKENINNKKASMSDEQAAANNINEYLKSYFGNNVLEFRAVESNKAEFKIYRNNQEANNLSEGECSLVGFCYFIAKLKEVDNSSIVWIDDPISSLDSNHIFFIFSLIDSELFENGNFKFKQLFISTHNLEFLKYLKRLKTNSNQQRCYYLVQKDVDTSNIEIMPKFIKEYATEFNYLFKQIYDYSNSSISENDEQNVTTAYNFANNLRKFLEIFLFYRYPNIASEQSSLSKDEIAKFFGEQDNSMSSQINRFANEYSHLRSILERGMKPINILESKKIAKFVLETIERKDKDQYDALCKSIGKNIN